MAKIKGKNIIISVGNDIIAGNTSCVLRISADIAEKTSPTTAQFKEFITKRTTWEASTESLLVTENQFAYILIVGRTVTIHITIGNITYVGSAIVKQSSIAGNVKDLARGTFVFQGTGPLTQEE